MLSFAVCFKSSVFSARPYQNHMKHSSSVLPISLEFRSLLFLLFISFGIVCAALPPSKYRGRAATVENVIFGTDAANFEAESECHQNIDIMWKSKIESNSVGTPIIADLFNDGRKQIVTAGVDFVEVVDAATGRKLPGWPCSFGWTSILADPILYDANEDGYDEVVISTLNGEIVFLNRFGEVVYGRTFKIPKTRIQKAWYSGLDSSSITVYMSLADASRYEKQSTNVKTTQAKTQVYKGEQSKVLPHETVDDKRAGLNATRIAGSKNVWSGFEGWLTDEGMKSLELFLANRPLTEAEEMSALFSPQYAHWIQANPEHHQTPLKNDIFVDAHIFEAPVIADLDGDGSMEMIVAVNYYFDDSITSRPGKVAKYPVNTDFSKYISCGVVVFSLKQEQILWITPLEVTTDLTSHLARIYSSPTVVDLNNDGKLEIIVGTAVGSVYVLKSDGTWDSSVAAITMDSIAAPIAAADVTGDGKLNLIVVDDGANVVCYDNRGTEIWENRVSSSVNHSPIIGDVDGDGKVDVILATVVGHIWALSGENGKVIKNFPIKLNGASASGPLVLPLPLLNSHQQYWDPSQGLSIIISCLDQHLYLIQAKTGCFEKVDLGEVTYGTVLADDLTSNGKLDYIMATLEGHIYVLGTSIDYVDNSMSWSSALKGRNGFTTGDWQGIKVLESTRSRVHVSGNRFYFSFEIVDRRPNLKNAEYTVTLWDGGIKWFSKRYSQAGVYTEMIAAPSKITVSTLKLELTNEHGQAFFDQWNVGFNQAWYRTLKWLLSIPPILLSLIVMFFKDVKKFLPS